MRFLTILMLVAAGLQAAVNVPAGFTHRLFADGVGSPTTMGFAPDGRLFVLEQGGSVKIIKNGTLLSEPFVTVNVDRIDERGMIGITFHPQFALNGYVYLHYTFPGSPRRNRVSRFTASGDRAVPGSEAVIVELDPLVNTLHNSGALEFGPDGKLYIAAGDNGTPSNAQLLTNRLGKILRVNDDGTIPPDNPFFATATGANRMIWALGLRNPFTFAFDRRGTEVYINDVGQSRWEEINAATAGANFGWPLEEGPSTDTRFRTPKHAYQHDQPALNQACAITGGTFASSGGPAMFPSAYANSYFFADYCGGWIRELDRTTGQTRAFADGLSLPMTPLMGPDGALYYLSRGHGAVYRIDYGTTNTPRVLEHPVSTTVTIGQATTFRVAAAGTALSYQWQRNGLNIPGATGTSFTLASPTLADSGAQFRATVTNSFGSVTSNAAVLTVTSNRPPTAVIQTPTLGATYRGGDVLSFNGAGTDLEDGAVPASRMTWRVDFHHDAHTHPALPETSGVASGMYNIAASGHTDTNVWFRVHLTVRDAGGLSHSTYRDVHPVLAALAVRSNPAGLRLTLDGQPVVGPVSTQTVAGVARSIGVLSPQVLGGVSYEFVSWSDGGAATHTIVPTTAGGTYTATFRTGTTPPPPPPPTFALRVDAAGGPYTDAQGNVWAADYGHSVGGGEHRVPNGITGTDQQPLYQSARWQPERLDYQFTVPNGTHRVTLKFAELAYSAAGQRVMRIVINGQVVEPSLDVAALAGGQFRALDRTYTATVTNGVVLIQLFGLVSHPFVNAIEVLGGSGPAPSEPPRVVTSPSNVSVQAGQAATFSVAAAGTPPLAYQWQRNGVNIAGATGASYTLASAALTDTGALFRVVVSSPHGSITSTAATLTVTAAPPPPTTAGIRVNAGGWEYTDARGVRWAADYGHSVGGGENRTQTPIAGTDQQPLYQSERWQPERLEYRFAMPNGPTVVTLKFAELVYNAAGQRVMRVEVNNVVVDASLDVASLAGGAFRALDRTYAVSVTNGEVLIRLNGLTGFPKVNAIQIVPGVPAAEPPRITQQPTAVQVRPGQAAAFQVVAAGTAPLSYQWQRNGVNVAGATGASYTLASPTLADHGALFRVVVTNAQGSVTSQAAALSVTAAPPTPAVAIRVNAGGPEYRDAVNGAVWAADYGFTVGSSEGRTQQVVRGTSDPTLYQSERWQPERLEYRFTVPNGTYRVTLKFAELFFTRAGQRVFGVAINGQVVEPSLDIVAQVGALHALDRTYTVTVTNGQVLVRLFGVVNHPKVNALEVVGQ